MTLFARRPATEAAGYSVIDEQLLIRGEVTTQGTIRIDGRIEGRLHRADSIIVGATGSVIGDIQAREVVIAGSVDGNVTAEARVEIQATGSVLGDVRSAVMLLAEGGVVHGHVAVDSRVDAATQPRLELAADRTLAR